MKDFFVHSFVANAGVISDSPSISEILLNVLYFLLSMVALVAIIATVITGVRYMLVQNTQSSANVKKSLTAIVLGLLAVMGSLIIVWQVSKFIS